jgi:hypothetical protein
VQNRKKIREFIIDETLKLVISMCGFGVAIEPTDRIILAHVFQ